MTIDTNTSKNIGGIGALLAFISVFLVFLPIPYATQVLMLAGAVMMLIGLYGLSGHFNEPGIFKNSLIGTAVGIIGIAIARSFCTFSSCPFLPPCCNR